MLTATPPCRCIPVPLEKSSWQKPIFDRNRHHGRTKELISQWQTGLTPGPAPRRSATATATRTRGAYDAGLRSYMLSVYNYMTSGVLLTGIVALLFAWGGA